MFERYTEQARRVIFFARYEASNFGSMTIETEHLLLGLLRENGNLIRRFIPNVSGQSLRQEIEARVTIRKKVSTSIDLPLTDECKRILVYANEEATQNYIGSEHILLGILREDMCLAAQILRAQGLKPDSVREYLAANTSSEKQSAANPASSFNSPPFGYERYTEQARRVIFFARYEASQFGSMTIETEHLLLGLLRENGNVVRRFLPDVSAESLRQEIEVRESKNAKLSASVDIPLTRECMRILAYAVEEANRQADRNVRTEHLLLAFLREEKCVAAEILRARGLIVESARAFLAHHGPSE